MHIKLSTNHAILTTLTTLHYPDRFSLCLSYFPTKNLSSLSSDFQENGHVSSCDGAVQPTLTLTVQALYSWAPPASRVNGKLCSLYPHEDSDCSEKGNSGTQTATYNQRSLSWVVHIDLLRLQIYCGFHDLGIILKSTRRQGQANSSQGHICTPALLWASALTPACLQTINNFQHNRWLYLDRSSFLPCIHPWRLNWRLIASGDFWG